ncbi:zincin-like metallopeptidase domain-containing protein [Legionella sp.]|uniref:zincin-like metallopeptidase domain-containing protein n=1 Tax=Legionella sp. TaxID=459 RepID=UPI000CCA77D4|nr:zincin-like metallopeptidase domain-containing protein [Legionella sp.]PJE09591.1 MAG: DNA primase [Legionella sp.]
MDKIPFHELVALNLIEQLKKGTAPWLKPWNSSDPTSLLPINPLTNKRYKGINAIHLMAKEYPDNRWLTYKQAATFDAQVRKGEKGTTIQYWQFSEERVKEDELGKPALNEKGEHTKFTIRLERPRVFYATVFNACQIEGMPPIEIKKENWALVDKAETILVNSGARLYHSQIDRAFYHPLSDKIHLPPKHQFDTAAHYYATALHELSHWTGHESRLNRDLTHPFGSEGYAREELRAEIASMILGEELRLGHDPSQHCSYIKSWIKVLEDDPLEIFRAAADAEKIQTFVLELEQKQILQLEPIMEDLTLENPTMQQGPLTTEKTWLAIPYEEKENAKSLLGKLGDGKPAIAWDKAQQCWYANSGVPLDKLKPWLPENSKHMQAPALSPILEFSEALISLGCILSANHPIMDGKTHRIETLGDKKGEKAGFYVAHLDEHPAGYIKNNRTGAELKWTSKGYSFSPEEKKALYASSKAKRQARLAEQKEGHEQVASRLKEQMTNLLPATQDNPYLSNKGITPFLDIFTDKEGLTTYIPAYDGKGKLWTMQTINEEGIKRFAKGSRKEGCFHALGGFKALISAPALVIGEGYATAATVAQALGFSTVAALDAGNLKPVALALQARFPDKPIVILGDDDKHLEATLGINTGKLKAQETAHAVKGSLLFPIFAPGEQTSNPKGFTDFNDLAMKSKLGFEGVKRQIKPIVEKIIQSSKTTLSSKLLVPSGLKLENL